MIKQLTNDLAEERRRLIEDILKHSGVDPSKAGRLEKLVNEAIHNYKVGVRGHASATKVHKLLAALYGLCNDADPGIGVIRNRIIKLPAKAVSFIEDKGKNVWIRLFNEAFPEQGFVAWSQNADVTRLLTALQHLTSDGGVLVRGRARPNDKRSAFTLKPIINGYARGKGSMRAEGHPTPLENGRPPADLKDQLLCELAFAWAEVTGLEPSFARTDRKGFGALIHHVFYRLKLGGADQALRRRHEDTEPLEAFRPGACIK